MVLSEEELQELQILKKEIENGEASVESTFRFLKLAIAAYVEQQQKDKDEKEEAIFNGQKIILEKEKKRGGVKRKNLGVRGTAKKKGNKRKMNKMGSQHYVRRQQKRIVQQRNREGVECGGARTTINKKGEGKSKRSYKELKLLLEKTIFFRDKG